MYVVVFSCQVIVEQSTGTSSWIFNMPWLTITDLFEETTYTKMYEEKCLFYLRLSQSICGKVAERKAYGIRVTTGRKFNSWYTTNIWFMTRTHECDKNQNILLECFTWNDWRLGEKWNTYSPYSCQCRVCLLCQLFKYITEGIMRHLRHRLWHNQVSYISLFCLRWL